MYSSNRFRIIPLAFLISATQANAADEFPGQILGLGNEAPSPAFISGDSPRSIHNAPLSTTVIDPELLNLLGISRYADAMWLVPGMNVNYSNGSFPTISYHNAKYGQQRRQGTFVDGISLTRPSVNNIEWNAIPLKFDTIEAIEVQRGASTIEYGNQAFLSSVNIRSKDEQLTSNYAFELRAGEGHLASATVSNSYDNAYYVGNLQTEKFDNYDDRNGVEIDNDSKVNSAYMKFGFPNGNSGVTVKIGGSSSDGETIYETAPDDSNGYKNDSGFLDITYTNAFQTEDITHEFSATAFGTYYKSEITTDVLVPAAVFLDEARLIHESPNLDFTQMLTNFALTGALPNPFVDATTPEDFQLIVNLLTRLQIEGPAAFANLDGVVDVDWKDNTWGTNFIYKASFSDKLVSTTSFSYKHIDAHNDDYFSGSAQADLFHLSENLQYNITDSTTATVGVGSQYASYLKRWSTSTRATLSHAINDSNTVRFVYSNAKRQPEFLDQEVYWVNIVDFNEGVTDLDGNSVGTAYLTWESEDLEDEKLESFSLNYLTRLFDDQLTIDTKAFKENYGNLISGIYSQTEAPLNNNDSIEVHGFETDVKFQTDSLILGAVYSYVDTDSDQVYETAKTSQHTGTAYGVYHFTESLSGSIAHYSKSANEFSSYDRTDMTFTHQSNHGDATLQLQLGCKYYENAEEGEVTFILVNPEDVRTENYEDNYKLFLSAKVLY